jgi:hypothetical protein
MAKQEVVLTRVKAHEALIQHYSFSKAVVGVIESFIDVVDKIRGMWESFVSQLEAATNSSSTLAERFSSFSLLLYRRRWVACKDVASTFAANAYVRIPGNKPE